MLQWFGAFRYLHVGVMSPSRPYGDTESGWVIRDC